MRVQMCDTETTVTGDDDDSPMLGALQDVGVDMKGRGEFGWTPLIPADTILMIGRLTGRC